jgi:hypothetical protein
MGFINYVLPIGVIYLVVIYGIKIVQVIINLLLSFLGFSKKTIFGITLPIQVFTAYLLTSLNSKVTLTAISGRSSLLSNSLYIAMGLVVVYMAAANMAQSTNERISQRDACSIVWAVADHTKKTNLILICGSLIYYGLSVFRPILSPSILIDPILNAISIASKLSLVGIIIKILGIINLIGIIMGGWVFSRSEFVKRYNRRAGGLIDASKL